ncbi:MAG: family 78 glycoside hydrolase catalytic domain [Planctomycetota bacterium]
MSTLLLDQARWIWVLGSGGRRNTFGQFRKDFELKSIPGKAPFQITADQNYKLFVNGQYVGRGPARGYQIRWPYDEYDVASVLQEGHNWISVQVYYGGISHFSYITEWHEGLLCAGKWKGCTITSDASWMSRISPGQASDTFRLCVQMGLQEHADARLDDQEWIRSAKIPRGWSATSSTRPYGSMPWHACQPRDIPNLGNCVRSYRSLVATAQGKNADGAEIAVNVVTPMRAENPAIEWIGNQNGTKSNDLTSIHMSASGKGRFTAIVLDLGEHSVGNPIIEVTGAAGGETLDFHYSELLDKNGGPFIPEQRPGSTGINMASRLVLKKGTTRFELHHIFGYRYVAVWLRNAERPIRLKLAHRETLYPLKIQGKFVCDDAVLNDIHAICVRTQQVCMLDSYVDTPWREQVAWWGDARVQVRNTFHLANDVRLLKRGIRLLSVQEVPNGLGYGHAPTNCHGGVLPDFSLIWLISIWDYVWQTGKTDIVHEQWPRIQRMLGYFTGEGRGKNGLLRYDERYWLFLDWSTLPKEGSPTLLNLWYLFALERLSELARLLGLNTDRLRLGRMAQEQKRLILKLLWDPKAELFRDGLSAKGKPLATHSLHNQTLGILCGLQPGYRTRMIQTLVLPYLKSEKVSGALPSSYWVTYVYEMMIRHGHGAEVIRHIRERFAPMIPYGGTWEHFAFTPGNGSVTHAWSAHPISHLAGALGGVIQDGMAWKKIRYFPVIDAVGVNQADVIVPTPAGEIRSRWTRSGDVVEGVLELPRGVVAAVRLSGHADRRVTGRFAWKIESPV